MVFEWQDEGKLHRVPKVEPSLSKCTLAAVFSTLSKDTMNPLTWSFFLLEKLENAETAPKYDSGVVLKGELHIKNEEGNTAKLSPSDTSFMAARLSSYSTVRSGYEIAARHRMH